MRYRIFGPRAGEHAETITSLPGASATLGQWVVRNASELAREVARARYSLLISDSYVCGLGLTGAPIERETATVEEMRLSSAVGESDSPWAVWTVDSASPAVASAKA